MRQARGEGMKIEVDIDEGKLRELVVQRIEELFSNDARYRDTPVRDMVRRLVDESAVAAIQQANVNMSASLPALAAVAVERALQDDITAAAKRGLAVLRKLYAGFDPSKLTPEQ